MAEEQEKTEEKAIEQETEEVSETTEEKPKKIKKVVRRRKTKKESENPLTVAIRLTVESGKVGYGSRKGVRALLTGQTKLVVLAQNAPAELSEDVEKFGKLSEIPVVPFPGTSIELGSICGKPFPVLVLAIYEEGVSPILEFGGKEKKKKK